MYVDRNVTSYNLFGCWLFAVSIRRILADFRVDYICLFVLCGAFRMHVLLHILFHTTRMVNGAGAKVYGAYGKI